MNKHFHISCFILVDIKKAFLYPQCSPLSALEIAELCYGLIGAVCSWGQIPAVVQWGERYTGEGLAPCLGSRGQQWGTALRPLPAASPPAASGHQGKSGGMHGALGERVLPSSVAQGLRLSRWRGQPQGCAFMCGVARLWARGSSVSPRAAVGARHLALPVLAGSECPGRDHSLLAPGLSEGKPGFSTPGGLVLLSTQRG